MMDKSQIREHMEIVGSDGKHVGKVDCVEGENIKLTKLDPAADGEHSYISLDEVDAVEEGAVWLSATGAEAKASMKDTSASMKDSSKN